MDDPEIAGMHIRDTGGEGTPVLFVHGFPETGHMWRHPLDALDARNRRGIAPDLPGWGRSDADPPHTWERSVEALERLHAELDLGPVILCVHDWGGLIGLRWACEYPEKIAALVITDTGFFADGKWSGMAEALQTPGTGEDVVNGLDREGFGGLMKGISAGVTDEAIDEYWQGFEAGHSREAALELYRSGDFSKIAEHDGALGRLGVPTLILWGEEDAFAPVAGAKRFEAEIPGSELVIVPNTGHFVWSDDPERCSSELVAFIERSGL